MLMRQQNYKFVGKEKKKHLMHMGDIKIFSNIKNELEILLQTITIYSQDKKMKFGSEKMLYAY